MIKRILIFILFAFNIANAGSIQEMQRAVVNHNEQTPTSDLFAWACENLTAEVFDATDGGTIVPDSDGAPSYSFVTGQTNNAIQLNSGTWAYVVATDTNNINIGVGKITFKFQAVSGVSSDAHRIISWSSTDSEFHLRRSSLNENRYSFSIAGVNYFEDTTENLYDGSWHTVVLEWNCALQTHSFSIDASTYSTPLTITDIPTGTGRLYFNGYNSASSAMQVNYDDVSVE